MKKKKNIGKSLKNNLFLLKLAFKTSPGYMIYLIFETIKQEGLVFLEHTIGIYVVLNAVEYHKPFKDVVIVIGIIILCWFISFLISAIFAHLVSIQGEQRVLMALRKMLYKKAKEMDLSCYDDPSYYNEFVLSVSEAENVLKRTNDIMKSVIKGVVNLITAGVFYLVLDAWAILFVFASFLLNFMFSNMINKVNYKRKLKVNPLERRRAYIHRVSYLHEYAKELKLNKDIVPILDKEFDKINDDIYDIDKRLSKKRGFLYFLNLYLANELIMDVFYITFLVYQAAVLGVISYSTVVILFRSSYQLRRAFRTIAELLPSALENSLYIEKIRNFLVYENKVVDSKKYDTPNQPTKVELKDVSFAYTKTGKQILNHINLTIEPGEKIALVGYNGAGKTTLVKLLMRLYDPTSGTITMDEHSIKDYALEDYRKQVATVFQDFKILAASVAENVVMSEVKERKIPQINDAIKQSGFSERLETLSNGLDTPLTTEFEENGVNLSGGESQKLAISRVFYKDANLILLDEPSSALDPISEYQLNHTMLKATKNKSVVFISHRLSTTKNCDRIIMLEHGEIIEQGTHDELLALDGKYAKMWNAQAECYING